MPKKELIVYQTESSREPLNDWLDDIKDVKHEHEFCLA